MKPKAYLAECEKCPLAERPVVYGDPDTTTHFDVIVVGEAPGQEEVKEGVPFIGRSGQLLRKVLDYNDIDPNEVYYTNAVLCHPEDNETPKAKAINACRARLLDEVKVRKPKHVIALGAVAAKSLLKSRDGITVLRKSGPVEHEDGYEVIPTFHTAAALRAPDHFPSIVGDVGKVNRVEVVFEPTKHEVAAEINAERMLRDQIEHADEGLLVGDIELDEPFDRHEPRLLCFGISHKEGHAVVYPREAFHRVANMMNQSFEDRRWGWQNGKFDIQYLWSLGVPDARVDEDTMLAHYATDERKGVHDLEQMATEILGVPFWKDEAKKAIKEENTLGFLPDEKLWEYNAADADNTRRLLKPLHKEMEEDDVLGVYRDLLIPGSAPLSSMEYRGVRINTEHLKKVEEDVVRLLEETEEPLHEWVDNPRSHPQVKQALHDLGFPTPNTQEDTIKDIPHEFVDLLLQYRHAFTIYSRYVRGLWKFLKGGRIHTNYLLHGTETGRTSSRKPNLQNIPIDHPVRESFVPSEGNVFIAADYAQIELRVMATVCQDRAMREIFIDGKRHIHKETALALFGENYSARDYVDAKSVSFGTGYGETARHLAYRLGIKKWEAQRIIDRFFSRYPGIKRHKRQVFKKIREDQYLTSLFGRKRRFWLITRDNLHDIQKEGFNFVISSPAADIKLSALIKIHNEKPYLNPVLDIHDEIVLDVPKEDAEDARREVIELMESVNPLDVPIIAEAEIMDRLKMKEA